MLTFCHSWGVWVCGDCELAHDILPEASTQPRLFHHIVFLSINHLQQPQLGKYLTGGNIYTRVFIYRLSLAVLQLEMDLNS